MRNGCEQCFWQRLLAFIKMLYDMATEKASCQAPQCSNVILQLADAARGPWHFSWYHSHGANAAWFRQMPLSAGGVSAHSRALANL
jgi:hypothetical protein